MANGKTMKTVTDFIFLGSKITADGDCSHEMKILALWKKSYNKPRWSIKKQRHHFADNGPYSESCGFPSSHVWMWQLDHEEGWALKNWCFWTVVLEKTLESPLDCKEIQPVHPEESQPWIFTEGLMLKLVPILWPPGLKSQLIGKRPWCWEKLQAGEGGSRGWDGWMESSTQWTWVWANSRRWWRTGKPGMLQSMGLQRVRHNWATEQQQKQYRNGEFCYRHEFHLLLCRRDKRGYSNKARGESLNTRKALKRFRK